MLISQSGFFFYVPNSSKDAVNNIILYFWINGIHERQDFSHHHYMFFYTLNYFLKIIFTIDLHWAE